MPLLAELECVVSSFSYKDVAPNGAGSEMSLTFWSAAACRRFPPANGVRSKSGTELPALQNSKNREKSGLIFRLPTGIVCAPAWESSSPATVES
jgi:hypothetical protein